MGVFILYREDHVYPLVEVQISNPLLSFHVLSYTSYDGDPPFCPLSYTSVHRRIVQICPSMTFDYYNQRKSVPFSHRTLSLSSSKKHLK